MSSTIGYHDQYECEAYTAQAECLQQKIDDIIDNCGGLGNLTQDCIDELAALATAYYSAKDLGNTFCQGEDEIPVLNLHTYTPTPSPTPTPDPKQDPK